MNVNLIISDEGSLYASLKYYGRFVGLHLTFSSSIWTELPYEEIHILANAANKYWELIDETNG